VQDIAATVSFYQQALGLEVVTFGKGRTGLSFGEQRINLHQAGKKIDPRAASPTPGSGDLCFLTRTPLGDWKTRLAAAGVAIEKGPVTRTGALGPIESIYVRDPDGNLVEIAIQKGLDRDPLEPLRAWLTQWQECVRAVDYGAGRALCAPELVAFGTRAAVAHGLDEVVDLQWREVWPRIRDFTVRLDEAIGGVAGATGWVAAPWEAIGERADGSTFERAGRLTVILERREGRWLATHTHFSLVPEP
jgi:catechol 2,3-dioxygenase-like lactoylglutathione lyase family enzyme/ketosteroid isomerase-like protein